jgi:hypothetical protein
MYDVPGGWMIEERIIASTVRNSYGAPIGMHPTGIGKSKD